MRKPKKLGFVGAGNMARALIKGVIASGLYRPSDLWVTDTLSEARRLVGRRYGVESARDNRELVRGSEVVLLAVKPQVLPAVLDECRPDVGRQLFVSIAAGVTLRRLEAGLGSGARVVRVMPNTPALLGKGMSVLAAGRHAKKRDLQLAMKIFREVGDALAVEDERLLDPVTGLSGSGPAYVYRFAEALIAAGIDQGLDEDVASRLVFRTLEGAAAMLCETRMSPKQLREMVSSPGGTTVAGLGVLERTGFPSSVVEAVAAATARSRELGAG